MFFCKTVIFKKRLRLCSVMDMTIFAGKGGVGKSTNAVAYALYRAETEKVLLVDYDPGHSITRVLDFPGGDQFPGDYGLIPFCDMITTFFGAPTDIHSVAKIASLIDVYHQALELNFPHIVVDVEPTGGIERLLSATKIITRSLCNLRDTGWVTLQGLKAKWPDIATYLQGDYIKSAGTYALRLEKTTRALQQAKYFLVCIPETSPVDQMRDVEQKVTSYGGKVNGFVINNIRGEEHEDGPIRRVREHAGSRPTIEIRHDVRLCQTNGDGNYYENDTCLRRKALQELGPIFDGIIIDQTVDTIPVLQPGRKAPIRQHSRVDFKNSEEFLQEEFTELLKEFMVEYPDFREDEALSIKTLFESCGIDLQLELPFSVGEKYF